MYVSLFVIFVPQCGIPLVNWDFSAQPQYRYLSHSYVILKSIVALAVQTVLISPRYKLLLVNVEILRVGEWDCLGWASFVV